MINCQTESETLSVFAVNESEIISENIEPMMMFSIVLVLFVVGIDEFFKVGLDMTILIVDEFLHWIKRCDRFMVRHARTREVTAAQTYKYLCITFIVCEFAVF